jgi:hypothetical protein
MFKRRAIIAGVCLAFLSGTFHRGNSQAGAPTDTKSKQQESHPMPQGPPNQKAVQNANADKPAAKTQTEIPGTNQTDATTIQKTPDAAAKSDKAYRKTLADLSHVIVSNIDNGCITQHVNLRNPDCVVEEVTSLSDGTTLVNIVPRCDKAHTAVPCWRIEVKPQCRATSKQSIGMTIDRGPSAIRPNTTASVSCAITN